MAGLLAQGLYLFALGQEYTAGVENGLFAGGTTVIAFRLGNGGLLFCGYSCAARYDSRHFLLPSVLALIALARLTRDWLPFSRVEAIGFWRTIHALAMTIGAAAVLMVSSLG